MSTPRLLRLNLLRRTTSLTPRTMTLRAISTTHQTASSQRIPRLSQPKQSTTALSSQRHYSAPTTSSAVEAPDHLNPAELQIFHKIRDSLSPSRLEVQDISGGCGSMYALDIVSERFRGLTVIKQHRLVNGVLADEIKGWHGVQLKTRAP